MPTFSSLPPEIRQQIFTYALQPSPPSAVPPVSSIKLCANNATALALSTVSKQWRQDVSYVHSTWRRDHALESILREEWTLEAVAQFKSVEGAVKRWSGDWRSARAPRLPGEYAADGLFDGGHEDDVDVEPEGVRLVRVLEWAKEYMTHLRARGFEQKQRNRELERSIEVQRRWLREAREREEWLEFRVKVLEEGMDRLNLDE